MSKKSNYIKTPNGNAIVEKNGHAMMQFDKVYISVSKQSQEEKEILKKRGERIRNLKNGLREYEFKEGTLWALNMKSAIAKGLKRNWTVSSIKEI